AAGLPPRPPETLRESAGEPAPCCYLSFDDGTRDHLEMVLPALHARNWRAIFFVPTAKLDQPGRLTRAQVRQLAEAGHTIGCHGHEHRRMDTMSPDAMGEQLDTALRILRDVVGGAPWIFAPPGGYLNAALRAAALERGLRVIRTMRWGFNRRLDLTALETVPIHCDTDARAFAAILAGRQPRALYAVKETLKALMPIGVYERLRALAFRLRRHR
ncbi:MAG: polysaccharide deacetylase family protein, partial [Verrucomicrobiales bacterium]|nr:polysaccharide deacetylase family protein [Verrucomicrobiales bacterium]